MSNELVAVGLIGLYALFCAIIYVRHKRSQSISDTSISDTYIAYGSQSGRAEALAMELSERIQGADKIIPITLNQLAQLPLANIRRLIVITSTYGDGEAPDNASRILSVLQRYKRDSLPDLEVVVLGLGDKNYTRYCGFAQNLQQAFKQVRARLPLALTTMEQVDEPLWQTWQNQVADTFSLSLGDVVRTNIFSGWQLHKRERINEGSQGGPVFHLQLITAGLIKNDTWQAGDIAEVQTGNAQELIEAALGNRQHDRQLIAYSLTHCNLRKLDANTEAALKSNEPLTSEWLEQLPKLPTRYYSIASVPREQSLQLLVRQKRSETGELGLGSGWLTEHASMHTDIAIHIRKNSNFHSAPAPAPIILIGNGTGIAGLRAHLAQRAMEALLTTKTPTGTAWLLFGERTRSKDRHFSQDLEKWQSRGVISKISMAFSRDIEIHRYVQDLIAPNASELREWVSRGAYIFVCGSLQGMAQGVDRELERALGANVLQRLRDENRYRRDVY